MSKMHYFSYKFVKLPIAGSSPPLNTVRALYTLRTVFYTGYNVYLFYFCTEIFSMTRCKESRNCNREIL